MPVVLRVVLAMIYTLAALPWIWLVWLSLLLTRLVSAFRKPASPPVFPPLPQPGQRRASLIVLSWNGRHLLEENLPSVLIAAKYGDMGHEVLVVDNGSNDGTVEFVHERFPEVRLVSLDRNLGFGEGNNAGVKAASQPFVVFLNNDMRVEEDFLAALLDRFDDDTFAVSSQIDFIDPAKAREETGKTAVSFVQGRFQYAHQPITEADMRRGGIPVFWAGGGSSAFHRDRFLWLGGFDDLYSPCYVEDTDISYRAWKMGWKVLFAPASRVHHLHRASSSKRFSSRSLNNLILRNKLLFTWSNLFDWKWLGIHGLLYPWNLFRELVSADRPSWWAFPRALGSWPGLMYRRLRRHPPRWTDSRIFRLCTERFRYYHAATGSCYSNSSERLRILMVTAYLPHLGYHAGAGRMFHLIQRMARRHDISVISFLENEEERERAKPLADSCRVLKLMRRNPDYIRSLYVYEPFDAFYSTPMRRLILETLEEQDYDLIHFEYAQMGRYYLPDCPIPQLFTEHEVNYQACRTQSRISSSAIQKAGWFYNYMQVMQREAAICRRMSKIICMTPEDARSLAGLVTKERLAVVRTGVDLEHFTPIPVLEKPNSMVFVGSFQHHPNCDAMLHFAAEIFPQVLKGLPDATLSIVGSRPPAEIVRLGDSSAVSVTGYVEDLRPYLAHAALYIVPLRLGAGIRGKILEAWAMQRPVIATSLACCGLAARHGENLWIADSAGDFADGIIRLLKDASTRQRLAVAGRQCALERYSWESATLRLEKVYRETLRDRSSMEGASTPDSRGNEV